MKGAINIFWFRRDLRLDDNVGLFKALQTDHPVYPIFIFDPEILEKLPKGDARINFIYEQLQKMRSRLQQKAESSIAIYHGRPIQVFGSLISEYGVKHVFTNHDYEPYAKKRDAGVKKLLEDHGASFKSFKDQVVFEKGEVVKDDGSPYLVYTPYKRRWKATFDPSTDLVDHQIDFSNFIKNTDLPNLGLAQIGFKTSTISVADHTVTGDLIQNYEATRNFPAKNKGTSRLGPHLRFGTVSIRKIVKKAIQEENEVFWNELIWREFFMQILWHFPHTVNKAFKPKYDRIAWRNNEAEFGKWKNGETGYALVDAGMRELNQTGYMHNRVRMLVASFLCKHLLVDWRWGEAYFAEKLLDFELASNVGNWQWAAGSGVDAAPYFRIFNPMAQVEKFDKQWAYVNKWVPNVQEPTYTTPIVDHKFARDRCLKAYKEAVR